MNKLTLLEEAQIRDEYKNLTEEHREVNEDTFVSIMESVKQTSAPDAKWFNDADSLLEDLGLGEFSGKAAQ